MLSSKSVTAPLLRLKPSRLLAAYTIAGHALGIMVLFYPMSIPVSARMLIALAVISSFIYHWRTREPVLALRTLPENDLWYLQLKNGPEVEARLYGEYTVTAWIVVMRFKLLEGGKITIVILPDSGEADEIRRMRVYLGQLKN